MGHRLGHLHDGGVEEDALQVQRLLARRQPGGSACGSVPASSWSSRYRVSRSRLPMCRSPQHLSAVTTSFALSTIELARAARARLAEHQLVVELGPDRHHQVAQPHEPRRSIGQLVEHPGDAVAPRSSATLARGQREDAARGRGDLVVALAGLEVLLVDLGPGREPVPEQIRQRRAAAAAVGGGVGVDPLEVRGVDARPGISDAFLAVDAREDPHPQRDDRGRQPVRAGSQRQRARGGTRARQHGSSTLATCTQVAVRRRRARRIRTASARARSRLAASRALAARPPRRRRRGPTAPAGRWRPRSRRAPAP